MRRRVFPILVLLFCGCSGRNPAPYEWRGAYFGGSAVDDCDAVAVDRAGGVYLACHVVSDDLPGMAAREPIGGDPMNAFVVKFSPGLERLEWGVLLAGSGYDGAFDIVVDSRGHVFVAGLTASPDFPATANAAQKTYGGGEADAFFAEISPAGEPLHVSFFGGGDTDQAFAIEVDEQGTLWLAGATWSADFPGLSEPASPNALEANAFLARIDLVDSPTWRSKILGGQKYEKITAINADGEGRVVVAGLTESADFPVAAAWQSSLAGASDGFIAEFRAEDLSLEYSTFFGGSDADAIWGIDRMPDGRVAFAGGSQSPDLPTTKGAFQRAIAGGEDAFIASLNPSASGIAYCSYFGGSGDDSAAYDGRSLSVDSAGHIWLAGQTTSTDLPMLRPLQAEFGGGDADGFVAGFDLAGGLSFASFVGGEGRDIAEGLALAPDGRVWVTGLTASKTLPFERTAQQKYGGGPFDCFLVGIRAPALKNAPR